VNVRVEPAQPEEQARIGALFELYVYDLSDAFGIDVGEDGRFVVPALDAYFRDPRCHAFLIRVDEKLAGFALVQRRSRLSGDEAVCDVAEFFVMRKYRRRGVGERVAGVLFDRFRGTWEVRQRKENQAATVFWRRAIGRYTGEEFEEIVLDDERWRGPVHRFSSARPP